MEEIFQKNAKLERYVELRRTGVLSAATFDDYSTLRAFLPSKQYRSLISHYWIVRWNIPEGTVYRPTEVLAEPVVNIFFLPDETFLYGLTTQTFDYEAKASGVMAGATFQPGGFYPFWRRPMSDLPPHKSDLNAVLSGATTEFSKQLLLKSDEAIAEGIEALVQQNFAPPSPHIATINAIISAVNFGEKLRSIKEVSQYFKIPERTLQHLFKQEVGVSLKWVIMRARMLEVLQRAYEQPTVDWARIANDLGYSSQAHFITDFKRATGKTPATFKKDS